MKNKKVILGIVVALVVAIGVTSAIIIGLDDTPKPATTETNQTTNASDLPAQADVVRFTAEANKNVLEQLEHQAAIETKSSSYGVYVDAINGKKGGENGKYWTFYVDGELAQVGADAYVTKGGELIEWKFE